uniref:Protein RIC1 homolog n=1 Tax=Globodera rostochiensis TaxID=31243 RepID=A0A914H3U2_GLORO
MWARGFKLIDIEISLMAWTSGGVTELWLRAFGDHPCLPELMDEASFSLIKNKIMETPTLVRVVVSVVFGVVSYSLRFFFAPTNQGFFCDDKSIRFPQREETVRIQNVYFAAIPTTVLLFTVGEFVLNIGENERIFWYGRWNWRQRLGQLLRFTTIWLLGMAINMFFLNLFKLSVGSLRPYFFTLCAGNDGICPFNDDDYFNDFYTCQRLPDDNSVVLDARRSFYSGHASIAFFFAIFLILYIHARILPLFRQFIDLFIALYALLIGAASFVAITRLTDHKHHSVDIVCGALAGTAVAVCVVTFHREHFFPATPAVVVADAAPAPADDPVSTTSAATTTPIADGNSDKGKKKTKAPETIESPIEAPNFVMFLPDSCDSLLRLPFSANVNYVVANRERTIVAVVSDENLYFYFADTRLVACIYQRDGDNLRERGPFTKAFWKPDSRSICVLSKNCLNIFSVEITSNHPTFNLHDPPAANSAFSRGSSEFYLAQNRPLMNVTLSVVAHLEAEPTSVLCFKEEFIVCLVDGWLHRMSWTGTVLQNLSFNIRSICATPNQFGSSFSKKDERHSYLDSLHVLDIAPFLGGICVVLSDGRGALLRSPSANFQPNSINALWAGEMNNACCCATNFKYRLIYFGTKSGDLVTYSFDDLNETLVQLFVVRLTLKNGTEFLGRLSSVRQIRCLSPNGNVFAVIWNSVDGLSGQIETLADGKKDVDCCLTQNGTETNNGEDSRWLTMNTFNETPPALAIFSPFGAQWWCSLEDHSGSSSSFFFTTLDWAHEGFQLWMGTTDGVQHINLIQSVENSHSRHVMMFGSDRVYLSPSISADQTVACSAPHLIWKVFKPPHNYLAVNGPIMLMATDFDCNKFLAVAGRHGFCLYNFKSAKWRMFRKEAQEQSLSLSGGIAIFEDFVICSACNTDFSDGENERIYAFHAEKQLDLDVANSIPTNKVLQMSLNHLHLLVFDVNSLIGIYSLSLSTEKGQKTVTDSLTLECLAEIRIAEFLPHPSCLVSMDLTRLNFHSDAVAFCEDLDSLLLNISGHLLLLSPMQPQLNDDAQSGKAQESDDEIASEFHLHPPTLIASFVEHFWTTVPSDRKYAKTLGGIAFLEDALWINAGCKNSVNDDYLACGASCVSSHPKASSSSAKLSDNISLATEDGSSSLSSFVTKNDFMSRLFVHNLVRVGEVFIHKLLKQLLKRNLGAFAFDLATACRSLSYFGHILELLLHDLLDEEATSSEPIPDPLLPTAVAFLREFPTEYLRTIVFCARKTELAFWSLLFSVSQHPRQLFQMCLQEGQLDTATSCLMILHSMENFKDSSKLAFRLLEEALAKRQWTVAQDIVRFMHSICRAADHEMGDIGAVSEGPESPLQHKLSSLQSHHHFHQSKAPSGFNSAPADEFAFPSFSSSVEIDGESSSHRHRSMSSGKTGDHQHNQQQKAQQISPPSKEKLFSKAPLPKLNTTKPSEATKNGRNLVDGYEKTDKILAKYAATLLEDYALRDLGAFSSYLQFDLISFLRKNAFSVAAAEFPVVLMKLHAQFNWPYPVSFSANLPVNHSLLPFNGSRISNGSTAIPSFVVGGRNAAEGDESEAKTEESDDERVQKGDSSKSLPIRICPFNDDDYFNDFYTCQRLPDDNSVVLDARRSFYSGHASIAFFFAIFLILYIHARILPLFRQFIDLFIALYALLIGAASFVAITRLTDHKHHSVDIVCGALAGTAVAVCVVSDRSIFSLPLPLLLLLMLLRLRLMIPCQQLLLPLPHQLLMEILIKDSCDSLLRLPFSANVNYVVANRERTIVAVVSDENLYFYFADTRLVACIYQRDGDNLRERGPFTKAFWKPDSRSICVLITSNHPTFNLHDPPAANSAFSRGSSEFYLAQNRPLMNVTLSVVAHLEAEPTSVLCFKEEFIVCLVDGWLHRMSWTGTVLQNLSFNIRSICATPNQFGSSFSKKDERHSYLDSLHVLDIAPFLGGICVVLSDGRGALLRSPSANFQPNSINALWAGEMNNACCCATNFKYRLIYFGTKSGDLVTYSFDDLNETLVQLFVVRLTLKNGTEFLGRLSSVRQIRCLSPNGNVFAVIWNSVDGLSGQIETLADGKKDVDCCLTQNGTETNNGEDSRWLTMNTFNETPPALAIFSPFGAQWWCSLEDHSGSSSSFFFTTLDWAHEGFQLWMGTTDGVQHINLIQSVENSHSRHVMMFGSDRVYLSPSISADQTVACSAPHLIWKVFKPPHNYLAVNGPIMEQSLSLSGGIAIFEDFVICSACNTDFSDGENERIYAFHAEKQLDLDVANSIPTNKVLQMSLNHLHLLVFDVNSLIGIYSLSLSTEKGQKTVTDSLTLECLAEIRIAEFLPHPSCLVSMDLTRLNFHSDAVAFCEDLDSLLLNISGHLLLLSPMQPQLNDDAQSGKAQESDDEIASEFHLHPPTLIASFVEHFWTTVPSDRKYAKTLGGIAFLEDALWINAGCKNSKIWLPLSTEQKLEKSSILANQSRRLSRQSSRSFISRRIMLPIDLDIYPLCVNDDYLACGASCVSSHPKASSSSAKLSDNISLATEDGSSSLSSFVTKNDFMSRLFVHNLVRVGEVFIHKLLKQLLKRNLGAFAFDLATACRSLSYFGHILELLLHDLLDEEATSSEPIPDPLLPTAVAFLREFPTEYLRTIVFCARKTELAFWSLLFSVSQHPRQLFQMCLQEGQLDTATSCLMILHSMENFKDSSKLAFRLLEEALAKRQWTVAQDIVRFMHSICRAADHEMGDIGAVSEGPESPLQHKLSSLQSHHHFHQSKAPSGFNSAPADEFAFPSFSSSVEIDGESSSHRHRSMSSGKTGDHQHNQQQKAQQISPPSKEKLFSKAPLPKLNTTKPSEATKNGRNLVDGYEKTDKILAKYAATLLEDYALRDLGAFSSYLQFDLISFLRKNAFSVAAAEFPVVLMKLHAQFNWPYPVSFSANLPVNHSLLPFNGSRISNGSTAIPSFVVGGRNAAEGDESEAKTEESDDERVQKGCAAAEGVGASALIFCNWEVLEKFCSDSKVRGTAQTEAEMAFVLDILQKTEAFEWIFLLCILCQDIRQVKERILTPMQRLPEGRLRMEQFLKRVRAGTQELFQWALFACPAYSTVMRVFKDACYRMGGINWNLTNLLGGRFAAVPFHFAPHFRWVLFGLGFTILGLAKGIILPPGAHLQSLSPVQSAELGAGCGRSTEALAPRRGRAHPWAVSFMTKGRNRLGGTIISPWHILTVAHGFLRFDTTTSGKCDVYGYRNFETVRHGWTVVYGDDCIWQQSNDYLCARPNLTQNRIRAIFVDDGFADGGLFCLFHSFVQIAIDFGLCQWPRLGHRGRIADGELLTVTSWGRRDAFHKGDPLIREIPLRHDAECKGRPWSDIMPTNVEDYLCAKALNPKDYNSARTCHGDSGSGMEWKKTVARVVGTLLPQRPIPLTVPLPAAMPSSISAFPSPSVELTNGSQAMANGSVTHQIATSRTEKRMPMPLDNKRRRAKIHSRHVLRSPLAIPQLELMKKWRNSRRQNERPTEEAFLSHPKDDLVKLLLNKVEESGEEEQNPVEREDRSEGISRTDRSEVISKTELIGVTSFGSRQCASDELARFTRMAHYVKKICSLTGVCYQLAGEERS